MVRGGWTGGAAENREVHLRLHAARARMLTGLLGHADVASSSAHRAAFANEPDIVDAML